jgi:septal ring factor EnvC (AmiA/AmiB activator)
MSQSNQNYTDQGGNNEGKKNSMVLYWVIIVVLLLGCIFLFVSKNQMKQENDTLIKQGEMRVDSVEKERKTLDDEFKAATGKIDELMSDKAKSDSALQKSRKELDEMKSKISVVIKKDKVSLEELKKAREMVKELNDKIRAYEERIAELEKENKELNGKNKTLTIERDSTIKQNIVLKKFGSVLYTNNIRLTPEHKKKDGSDKETKKAKKTNVLRITFDIVENHIAESGNKQIYLRLVAPDQKVLSNTANASGNFTGEKGDQVAYSVVKEIALVKDQPVKDVTIDWNQEGTYQKGVYTIEIYSEGFKVGSGQVTLK